MSTPTYEKNTAVGVMAGGTDLSPNRAAYRALLDECAQRGHMAMYWELFEDGYDPKVDYYALLKERRAVCGG